MCKVFIHILNLKFDVGNPRYPLPTINAAIHLDVRSGKVANLPAFLRHFTEARPLSVVVSRRFQSRASRSGAGCTNWA